MKKAAIPASKFGDKALNNILTAVKELLEAREGDRGDPKDAFVSFRDLIDGAVVDYVTIAGKRIAVKPVAPLAVVTTPPAPQNLTVTGAFTTIMLQWDAWGYSNHSYAEIWRNATNDLGTATLIGSSPGVLYADSVSYNKTYYYWVRFVNYDNVKGPYNATSGTVGQTQEKISDVLTAMADKILKGHVDDGVYNISANLFAITQPSSVNTIGTSTGHTNGTYTDVALTGGAGSGIRARVTVASGVVSAVLITTNGTGYAIGNVLVIPGSVIGGADVNCTVSYVSTSSTIPFIVDSIANKVYINTAVIEDASITNAKIDSVDAGKISAATLTAITANLGDVTAGTLKGPSNRFVIDLNTGYLAVYDATGTLRVKLGLL
jgi:hypothetical protein